ncbi:MAG: (2Fe-2S)-binding protein [Spirochaetales bacterium]|nr:(2Fe-2S)-binding protein [Spirochaetales bacterium]
MNRVTEHPILGSMETVKQVEITIDGKVITALEGETIAAALSANNIRIFRQTTRFKTFRKIFCGIGQCTDCIMIVDGKPNVRTCVTRVKAGMSVRTQIGRGEEIFHERD